MFFVYIVSVFYINIASLTICYYIYFGKYKANSVLPVLPERTIFSLRPLNRANRVPVWPCTSCLEPAEVTSCDVQEKALISASLFSFPPFFYCLFFIAVLFSPWRFFSRIVSFFFFFYENDQEVITLFGICRFSPCLFKRPIFYFLSITFHRDPWGLFWEFICRFIGLVENSLLH